MLANSTKKAAILIASLDRDLADQFLDRLPDATAAEIRNEIFSLGPDETDLEEDVIREFLQPSSLELSALAANDAEVREESPEVGRADDQNESLSAASAEQIAAQLKSERPQTIAAAIGMLSPPLRSRVLELLPEEVRVATHQRMESQRLTRTLALTEISDELSRAVESRGQPTEQLDTDSDSQLANSSSSHVEFSTQQQVQEFIALDDTTLARVISAANPRDVLLAMSIDDGLLLKRMQRCLSSEEVALLRRRREQMNTVSPDEVQLAIERLAVQARDVLTGCS